jgi:hypothetical protein
MPAALDPRRLRPPDLVQLGAAVVVGISVFLPWYTVDAGTPGANVEGHRGDVTAWVAHPTLRWVLLAAVAAALWSAWQTVSGQVPTRGFSRGETSIVVAVIVLGFVLIEAFIARPGDPSSAIGLAYGWFVALAGALAATVAAVRRLPAPGRKPPGV